jgi:hypothetical protein
MAREAAIAKARLRKIQSNERWVTLSRWKVCGKRSSRCI